jgi:hypothetical protein
VSSVPKKPTGQPSVEVVGLVTTSSTYAPHLGGRTPRADWPRRVVDAA